MTVRIGPVDPHEFAPQAAAILREAWHAPCLVYNTEYLAWQFRFPGPRPLGVAATVGTEPVGFAAATPRRLRFRRTTRDVYLVSFVAVRPGWRRSGVAIGLYAALLAAIRESGQPIVTFAESGSGGQKLIERSYPKAHFRLHSLGESTVFGCVMRPDAPHEGNVDEEVGFDALREIIGAGEDRTILRSDPDRAQLDHYDRDPRPHAMLVARDPDGRAIGAVRIVRPEVLTSSGLEPLTMVESVFLARPGADGLRPLLVAACRRWAIPGAPMILTAPNLGGVAQSAREAVGLRRTRSRFERYLASADPADPLFEAEVTDLEIN